MDAMILAAGAGRRMRPLTGTVPKPLLEAGGKALIEHVLEALAEAGFGRIVINHARLGKQLVERLGNGVRWGVRIVYSDESAGALETAGGIRHALPLLSDPFVVVNADLYTDFPFAELPQTVAGLAHIILVDNPAHHPQGDFAFDGARVVAGGGERLTFAGIGVYTHTLFAPLPPGPAPLAPLLHAAAAQGRLSAEVFRGQWVDVGTPERLAQLDRRLREAPSDR